MAGVTKINWPSWEDYVRAPVSGTVQNESRRRNGEALSDQRKLIESLIDELDPQEIACLGAGYLNDIPLEKILANRRVSYLVDFIPNVCLEGVGGSIIQQNNDRRSCLFCEQDKPSDYCVSFSLPVARGDSVCDAFRLDGGHGLRCSNYVPGCRPEMLAGDVTAGRATRFAQQMSRTIRHCNTPQQAFRRAIEECRRCGNEYDALSISDASLDLVTSSMVISQFDNEPYRYFASLLELRFGQEAILKKEKELFPLMEQLRADLFRVQVDGHAAEMHRMLKKQHGKAYVSVELFRTLPTGDDFFLVQEIPQAMEVLGKYFFFDFRLIPPAETLRDTKMGAGSSIIECYVLTPRTDLR